MGHPLCGWSQGSKGYAGLAGAWRRESTPSGGSGTGGGCARIQLVHTLGAEELDALEEVVPRKCLTRIRMCAFFENFGDLTWPQSPSSPGHPAPCCQVLDWVFARFGKVNSMILLMRFAAAARRPAAAGNYSFLLLFPPVNWRAITNTVHLRHEKNL